MPLPMPSVTVQTLNEAANSSGCRQTSSAVVLQVSEMQIITGKNRLLKDHSNLSGLLIGSGYTMTQKTSFIQLPTIETMYIPTGHGNWKDAWTRCTAHKASKFQKDADYYTLGTYTYCILKRNSIIKLLKDVVSMCSTGG